MPLYELDGDALLLKSKSAFSAAAATLVQYNLGLVLDAVPRSVFATFGLDFDLWYATPRTIVDKLRFVAEHKRKRPGYRAALDTLAPTYDVRCGPVAVFQLRNRQTRPRLVGLAGSTGATCSREPRWRCRRELFVVELTIRSGGTWPSAGPRRPRRPHRTAVAPRHSTARCCGSRDPAEELVRG